MRSTGLIKTVFVGGLTLLAACSDSTSADRRVVSVSFSTQSPAAAAAANLAAFDVTVGDGSNTLVITKAQLVIRKLELKQSVATTCPETDDNPSADDCEEVKVGPMLVDLPLTADAATPITASVPAGTYRELEFKIHVPTATPADQAFAAANPNFANASIRLEGTYNGNPFVFTSNITDNFELEFDPPITFDADNQNVTINVDLSTWFKSGSTVIDPTTANPGQPNETLVRNNIRASFKAFDDEDRDGQDDEIENEID